MKIMEIKELTKAEMEIMKIIWEHGQVFLADIFSAMPDPRPAYPTVSTVVRVLVNKGFVRYESFSKYNRYEAAVSKEDYTHRAIERMKRDLFGGSLSNMVSFFAKSEEISEQERSELQAMLSEEN